MEMLLTGDLISAADAFRIGLVNRVVPAGSELDAALALARKIAGKSSHVVRIGKEAFYRQLEMGLDDAYRYTAEVMATGGNATPTRSSVTPMRPASRAISRLSAAQASTQPPADGVAVDRGHHRPGMREHGGKHRAQRWQEFANVRRAAVEEPLEVNAGGKDVPAAGQHHGGGLRRFLDARSQRLAELQTHGIGLAVGHACESVIGLATSCRPISAHIFSLLISLLAKLR